MGHEHLTVVCRSVPAQLACPSVQMRIDACTQGMEPRALATGSFMFAWRCMQPVCWSAKRCRMKGFLRVCRKCGKQEQGIG